MCDPVWYNGVTIYLGVDKVVSFVYYMLKVGAFLCVSTNDHFVSRFPYAGAHTNKGVFYMDYERKDGKMILELDVYDQDLFCRCFALLSLKGELCEILGKKPMQFAVISEMFKGD